MTKCLCGSQKIFFLILASALLAPSLVQAQSLTLQGKVANSAGQPVIGSTTQFRVQILSPNAEQCVLYDESHQIDLSQTGGLFSINLNDGGGTKNAPTTYTLEQAISNGAAFTVNSSYCDPSAGTGMITYTPASTDNRKVIISFKDPTSMSGFEQIPAVDLNPSAYAFETRSLGGFGSSSVLRVSNAGVPGTAPMLTSAQVTELLSLIGGTSTNYMSSTGGSTTGARLPTVSGNPASPAAGSIWFDTSGSGAVKYYDSTGTIRTIGTGSGSGTISSITAGTGLLGGGSSGSVTLSLANSGAVAATYGGGSTVPVITVDAFGRITSATTAAVTGTLPAGTSGQYLKSDGTNWSSQNIGLNDLKSTSSGGLFSAPECAANQSLFWESATDKIKCQNIGALDASAISSGSLAAARLPGFTGDVTAAAGNNALTLSASGVTAGTYKSVTVDAKGRVTAATNPTTLSGYGITNAVANLAGTTSITTDNTGVKPGGQIAGRLYVDTLNQKISYDNGTAWVDIAGITSGGFSGSLSGDVTGTQGSTVVAKVGTSLAADVHSAELAANAATATPTASTIAKWDGTLGISANAGKFSSVVLRDTGSNTITLAAPNTVTTSYTLRLPAAVGAANTFLTTDASGNLSWASPSATSVSATLPLTVTGSAGSQTIAMPAAASGVSGYLSSSDWANFSGKLSSALNSAYLFVGSGTNVATGVPVSGDVSLTNAGAFTVNKIGNVGVTTAASATGNVLRYNGTAYAPSFIGMGDLRSIATGAQALTVGCTASQTLTWNSATDSLLCSNIALPASQISGVLPAANGGTGAATANQSFVFAGPSSGGSGAPSFRALTSADLPAGSITGSGTSNYVPYFSAASTLANSPIAISGGNVGIGTTAPVQALEVSGSIVAGASGASRVQISNGGGSLAAAEYYNAEVNPRWALGRDTILTGTSGLAFGVGASNTLQGGGAGIGMVSNGSGGSVASTLGLYTSNGTALTERMRINSSGNVGIGTTNPSVALDVGARTDAIRLPNGTTAQQPASPTAGLLRFNTTNSALEFHNGSAWSTLTTGGAGSYLATTGGAITGDVTTSGNFTQTGATTFSTGSGAVSLNGPTTVASNFTVNGTSNLNGQLNVTSSSRIGSTFSGTIASTDGSNQNGVLLQSIFAPSANTTNSTSLSIYPNFAPPSGSTITNSVGLYVQGGAQSGAGSVTNGYGLYVANPAFGTNKYAAYFGGSVGIETTNPSGNLNVSGTPGSGTSPGLINITATNDNSYQNSLTILAPNLTAGHNNAYLIGRDASNHNAFNIGFNYVGSGLGTNFLGIQGYGQSTALAVTSGGSVGVGTTAPASRSMGGNITTFANAKLDVAGQALSSGNLVAISHNYATAIDDTVLQFSTNQSARNSSINSGWSIRAQSAATSGSAVNLGFYSGYSSAYGAANDANLDTLAANPTLYLAGSGNVGVATTSPVSKLHVGAAPTASANYGLASFGSGAFDGTTAGFYAGSANGTLLAGNTASGYTGDLINLQVAGVSKFKVDASGNITTGGAFSASSGNANINNSGTGNTVINGGTNTGTLTLGNSTGGVTVGGATNITSTTASTSATTGALTVAGGLGVSGTLNANILAAANGAAATPSHTFTSDLTTGMWAPGSNGLAFSTNATEKMRILSNGNVGIGSTAPAQNLSVTGTGSFTSTLYVNNNITGTGTGSTGTIQLGDSTISKTYGSGFLMPSNLTVQSVTATLASANNTFAGNVGIGTTNPQGILEIRKDQNADSSLWLTNRNSVSAGTTNSLIFGGYRDVDGSYQVAKISAVHSAGNGGDLNHAGALAFFTQPATASGPPEYPVERMRIDKTGNVGIGTTAPGLPTSGLAGSLLDIGGQSSQGNLRLGNSGGGSIFEIKNDNAVTATLLIQALGGSGIALRGNGNVGIGSATPGYPLDINGSARATSFISTSDARLKTNVRPIEGLEIIRKLRGVRYNWIKDKSADFGVIAQEVEKVLPEAVSTDASGYKAVKYPNLVSPLIEATKDLYGMCKANESEIQSTNKKAIEVERKLASVQDENSLLKQKLTNQEKILKSQQEKLEALSQRLERMEKGMKKK
jgi:hypothetical protein